MLELLIQGSPTSKTFVMDLRIQLLRICMTLIFFLCFNSSFATPTEKVLRIKRQENFEDDEKDTELGLTGILRFFNPKTCTTRNTIRKACNTDQETNETMCLIKECCPAKEYIRCYKPIRDNARWAFRISMIGLAGLAVLGCIPVLCCYCLQGCTCANPLKKENEEVGKIRQQEIERKENIGGYILDLIKEDAESRKQRTEGGLPKREDQLAVSP
ncbi:uncharacterized protein LOC115093318 [Rhinatrema bivittatum]|uniref:uncharacterized protein LOC115093318 n=1 Tax=Rhinatrema bivittatum TaxID=194408 RepID=UPI00112C22B7|nr:uncharacterized protein LOC115093318 [Rhinatrema bivittatum]